MRGRMLSIHHLILVMILLVFGVVGREPGRRCVFFFDRLKPGQACEKKILIGVRLGLGRVLSSFGDVAAIFSFHFTLKNI